VCMHTRSYVHIFIVTTTSAKSINTIALLETTKLGSNFPSPFSVSTSGGFFSVRPRGHQGTAIVGTTVDPPRKNLAETQAVRQHLQRGHRCSTPSSCMVYRLRGGIGAHFPIASACNPVCHTIRYASLYLHSSHLCSVDGSRLCMSAPRSRQFLSAINIS